MTKGVWRSCDACWLGRPLFRSSGRSQEANLRQKMTITWTSLSVRRLLAPGKFCSWFGCWRQNRIVKDVNGTARVMRVQRCEKLCEVSDRYRCKRDVQPILDAELKALNENRTSPESTLSVCEYTKNTSYRPRSARPGRRPTTAIECCGRATFALGCRRSRFATSAALTRRTCSTNYTESIASGELL
jgi:hypothetical protein